MRGTARAGSRPKHGPSIALVARARWHVACTLTASVVHKATTNGWDARANEETPAGAEEGSRSASERAGARRGGGGAREEIVRLVREKRYEEALTLLYAARSEDPRNEELVASIRQIKAFLIAAYARKLGGLDRVPGPIPVAAGRSPEALMVARYVDGTSTFDEISQVCPLGRLRTLQLLVGLYASAPGARETAAPEVPATPPPPPVFSVSDRPSALPMQEPPSAHEEARDSYVSPLRAPQPSAEDLAYREVFARGTTAFVQRKKKDAIAAFEECLRMRPNDVAAQTMLRRAQQEYGDG